MSPFFFIPSHTHWDAYFLQHSYPGPLQQEGQEELDQLDTCFPQVSRGIWSLQCVCKPEHRLGPGITTTFSWGTEGHFCHQQRGPWDSKSGAVQVLFNTGGINKFFVLQQRHERAEEVERWQNVSFLIKITPCHPKWTGSPIFLKASHWTCWQDRCFSRRLFISMVQHILPKVLYI